MDTAIRLYLCCGSPHAAMEATAKLLRENKIKPEEIDYANVLTSGSVKLRRGFYYEPLSVLQARAIMWRCVAAVVLDSDLMVSHFDEERIGDPAITDIVKKKKLKIIPRWIRYILDTSAEV